MGGKTTFAEKATGYGLKAAATPAVYTYRGAKSVVDEVSNVLDL